MEHREYPADDLDRVGLVGDGADLVLQLVGDEELVARVDQAGIGASGEELGVGGVVVRWRAPWRS